MTLMLRADRIESDALEFPAQDTQKTHPCGLGLNVHVSDGPGLKTPIRPLAGYICAIGFNLHLKLFDKL